MCEDIVPQRLAQPSHGFALAGKRAVDEVEGAPQLKKESEDAHGTLFEHMAAHEAGDRFVSEGHRWRGAALCYLPFDERIDRRHVAVVARVEEADLQQLPVFDLKSL